MVSCGSGILPRKPQLIGVEAGSLSHKNRIVCSRETETLKKDK
jgi:hypothetical protein